MTRHCVVVAPDATNTVWKQLPFGKMAGKNEAWLRDLLHAHPELVPLDELDPTYGPLVPICTELPAAGRIDNVFISPQGRLTLVECKLWNNVESRRKVVAQILDYGKEVTRWTSTDLAARVASRLGPSSPSLFELVRARHPDVVEQDFHDGVAKSLREGRFQLLIAGDGIREEVRGIADLINRNATSAFSFGLFQVELYENPTGSIFVQARAVARTQIVERTVIILQEDGRSRLESIDVEQSSNEPQGDPSVAQKIHAAAAAWWTPVLESQLTNQDQDPFQYYWPHNVRSVLPWHGTWITAYRSPKSSPPMLGVFIGGREHPLSELLRAILPDWKELCVDLPEGTEFEEGKRLEVKRQIESFPDEDSAQKWLVDAINRFVNVIRPRAATLARN